MAGEDSKGNTGSCSLGNAALTWQWRWSSCREKMAVANNCSSSP